jgi:hypothetical protein
MPHVTVYGIPLFLLEPSFVLLFPFLILLLQMLQQIFYHLQKQVCRQDTLNLEEQQLKFYDSLEFFCKLDYSTCREQQGILFVEEEQ